MTLSKTEKGIKRACQKCETRFYDLQRKPIICPVCKDEYEIGNQDPIFSSNLQNNNKNKENSSFKINEMPDSQLDAMSEEDNEDNEIISLDEAEEEEQSN